MIVVLVLGLSVVALGFYAVHGLLALGDRWIAERGVACPPASTLAAAPLTGVSAPRRETSIEDEWWDDDEVFTRPAIPVPDGWVAVGV